MAMPAVGFQRLPEPERTPEVVWGRAMGDTLLPSLLEKGADPGPTPREGGREALREGALELEVARR